MSTNPCRTSDEIQIKIQFNFFFFFGYTKASLKTRLEKTCDSKKAKNIRQLRSRVTAVYVSYHVLERITIHSLPVRSYSNIVARNVRAAIGISRRLLINVWANTAVRILCRYTALFGRVAATAMESARRSSPYPLCSSKGGQQLPVSARRSKAAPPPPLDVREFNKQTRPVVVGLVERTVYCIVVHTASDLRDKPMRNFEFWSLIRF